MADNIAITAGSGTTVATEDVGGVHHQKVKMEYGADGAATLVEDAAPLPVRGASDVIVVTLSTDTSAYADGDVLADTQAISNAVRANGGRAILQDVTILDKDDQGAAMDLVFLNANNSLGTENAAPNISDTNAEAIDGFVSIATTDYIDLGGCKVACVKNIGLMLEATGASTTLYIGAITRGGTPTYSASGLIVKLKLLWD